MHVSFLKTNKIYQNASNLRQLDIFFIPVALFLKCHMIKIDGKIYCTLYDVQVFLTCKIFNIKLLVLTHSIIRFPYLQTEHATCILLFPYL